MGTGGVGGASELRPWKPCGGREGEMELGGVGSSAGCFLAGSDLAATAAKLSRPAQKLAFSCFGMFTEAVVPATAMATMEVLLSVGAICAFEFSYVSFPGYDKLPEFG